MDLEQQKYFENYFELFSTPGWKQFVEDILMGKAEKEQIAAYSAGHDDLMKLRGELNLLRRIENFESAIRNQYDMENYEDADV